MPPLILVAFEDALSANHFLRVAAERQERSGVHAPLWISDRHALAAHGPFSHCVAVRRSCDAGIDFRLIRPRH